MSNQLSNVLGVAIPYDLKRQMSVRSQKLAADTRSNNDLEYLANKSCWVRLISSVRIKDVQYFKRYFPNLDITDGDSLAKKFILFAGTSEYKKEDSGFQYNIRSGFGANGSYGMLGNVETQLYGYKPMPGITDARIETQGKLGSIRSAIINFKAWDKAQLDIIDALYFKLGYTMFLEWGHTTYFDNGDGSTLSTPQLKRSDLKQIDPFSTTDLKKETILREISTRIDDSNGNYDAMLGMCTNFNFSMNEDGGYDCTIKMIALGELASQIKINQPNALPTLISSEIKELADIYTNILREKARQARIAAEILAAQNNTTPQADIKLGINETLNAADPSRYGRGDKSIATDLINDDSLLPFIYRSKTNEDAYFANNPKESEIGFLTRGLINPNASSGIFGGGGAAARAEWEKAKQLDEDASNLNLTKYGDVLYNYDNTPPAGTLPLGKGLYSKKFGVYIPKDQGSIIRFVSQMTLDGNILKDAFNFFDKYSTNKNWKDADGKYVYGLNEEFIARNTSRVYYAWFYVPIGTTKKNTPLVLRYTIPDIDWQSGTNRGLRCLRYIINDFIGNTNDRQVDLSKFAYNIEKETYGAQSNTTVTFPSSKINSQVYESLDIKTDKNGYFQSFKVHGTTAMQTVSSKDQEVTVGTTVQTQEEQVPGTTPIEWDLIFYDSSIIKDMQPAANQGYKVEAPSQPSATTTALSNPEDAINIDVDSVQAQEKLNYQSGLEVFIRAIQLHSFNLAYKDASMGKISAIDLYGKKNQFIKDLFDNGVLKNVAYNFATDKIKSYKTIKENDPVLELVRKYASYGFNHNLMSQPYKTQKATLESDKMPQVKFQELYKSYVVPYSINQGIAKDIDINYPVYIKFGLLLMALNHMCTIYDSKSDPKVSPEEQTPLIYIDFNPETNFCLSEPLQMSTDPLKMLIPFRGTNEEYSRLFDPKLIKNGKIIPTSGSSEYKDLFTPQNLDYISSQLPEFKGLDNNGGDAYSGKIMNILLSCDYLLSLCKNFANKDQTQSVKLRPFLQQIIDDINKYLGGINLLRLAYDDKSNCLYVVDDQVQPMKLDEKSVPDIGRTNSEIPVFGKYSIARSLEIRTDISSKLSNMIAISANSDIKSDASKDGTPFGHFSENYTDRFIPQVLSINASDTSKKNNDTARPNDTEISAAAAFNDFMKCALNTGQVSDNNVSAATNYYIDRMNKRKGENDGTKSSAMIPISVNFSTDGISGLAMGHAFLLPKEVLPISYEKISDPDNIIGFVVTGLNHTLQSNMWTTEVKANMMYLKNDGAFKASEKSYNIKELSSGQFIVVPATFAGSSGAIAGNYIDAKASALSTSDEDEAIFRWAVGTEGTILYIQWDIANWRTGHGSGTITLADSGKVINLDARKSQWPSGIDRANGKLIYTDIGNDVEINGQQFPNGKIWKPKMSSRSEAGIITQADADADLRRRIKQDFKPKTISTLKSRGIEWDTLPLPVKVAMVKACYGYGNVPVFMTDAYKSGGQSTLASVLLAKSQVPGNSDYGAKAAAFLLS